MNSLGRYIARTTLGAFALVLVSLTAIIWVTHALREIDLMTSQGQTVLVFIGITGLLIPLLVLVIAPVALMIAVAYTLNKLSTDSEVIVMNAAGMSPWQLFRPFLVVAAFVAVMVAVISAYVAPKGLRELRAWATQVRTDFVTYLVQPGRFITMEKGLIFHLRERRPDGKLMGIFVDDRRQTTERATFLAEYGEIIESGTGNFLVLVNGSVQRHRAGQADPAIVIFDRYAFDLSRFGGTAPDVKYTARERYLWDIAWPDPKDPLLLADPGQFRAELHDRLVAPFYPIVFAVIAFVFLGQPRTTRQSRGLSITFAISAVAAVRFIGFGAVVIAGKNASALFLLYGSVGAAIGVGLWLISRGTSLEPPAFVTNGLELVERLARRAVPT